MRLRTEAAAKKFEREHNARAWAVWHIAALQRAKKLPSLNKMLMKNTGRPRQTWRQQLEIMADWAAKHNAWEQRRKEMSNGG